MKTSGTKQLILEQKWDLKLFEADAIAKAAASRKLFSLRNKIRLLIDSKTITLSDFHRKCLSFFLNNTTQEQQDAFIINCSKLFKALPQTIDNGEFIACRLYGISCVVTLAHFDTNKFKTLKSEIKNILNN